MPWRWWFSYTVEIALTRIRSTDIVSCTLDPSQSSRACEKMYLKSSSGQDYRRKKFYWGYVRSRTNPWPFLQTKSCKRQIDEELMGLKLHGDLHQIWFVLSLFQFMHCRIAQRRIRFENTASCTLALSPSSKLSEKIDIEPHGHSYKQIQIQIDQELMGLN